ncbi:MAG: hypothetical protein H6727_00675 [Myxococcales bacterium]|nr:hypothetical protein [Myxococcales bacterium]
MRYLCVALLLASLLLVTESCVGQIGPTSSDVSSTDGTATSPEKKAEENGKSEGIVSEPAVEPSSEPSGPEEPSTEPASEPATEPTQEPVSTEPTKEPVTEPMVEPSEENIFEPVGDGGPVEVTPEPQNNTVAVFMAQGDIGRTMMSCDDGLTWKANRSWELEGDAAVCGKISQIECYNLPCDFMNKTTCETKTPCDCDHHPGAPLGMAYGDGWFVGTWGWGPPGSVRRSQDGINWETVITGTTFGGIDYGASTFVTGDRSPRVSSDGGKTWTMGGKADLKDTTGTVWNVRSFAFAGVGDASGRFIVTGQSGTLRDVLISADKGQTWNRPNNLDRDCADGVRGIVGGNGVILILTGQGNVCRSTDAGQTFTKSALPATPSTKTIWDGTNFHYWVSNKRYSSPDGVTWTATNMVVTGGGNISLGAIERSSITGTYVSVRGGWANWYSKQEFYRSTDGINWTRLPATDFTASHRIRHIRFGYVKRSAKGCP